MYYIKKCCGYEFKEISTKNTKISINDLYFASEFDFASIFGSVFRSDASILDRLVK